MQNFESIYIFKKILKYLMWKYKIIKILTLGQRPFEQTNIKKAKKEKK